MLRLTPRTSPICATVMSRCSKSLLAARSVSGERGVGRPPALVRSGTGVSFQLREGGDDTEYESSARRAGVDVLLQGLELGKSVEFSTLEDSRPPRQIGVS